MTNPISEERLRNTRAWAAARVGSLSGADVIVGAIDELISLREAFAARRAMVDSPVEPEAPQSPRFTYKDWLDRDCCYNCKRPITSCFCNGSPLNRDG